MLEKDFAFDLQMFADSGVDGEPAAEQPVEDSANEDFDFGIDDEGNVVFRDDSIFGDGEAEEVEDSEVPDGSNEQPEQPANDLYTVKVNGQEMQVPLDELLHGYMRNADYTHKTQALAEQRRALERQYQPQRQTEPTPAEPKEPQVDQKVYYQKLAEYAKGQVQQILGEDYDDFNPIHQAALADTVATIKAQVYEQQQIMKQQEAVEAQFNSMMDKYRQDPNFQAIDNFALEKFNELPYSQAIKIKEALDRRDTAVIDSFYTAVMNEYYGNRNVPTITPPPKTQTKPAVKVPFVENAGAAPKSDVAESRNFDWSKLSKMTTDQQAKLVSELGFLG